MGQAIDLIDYLTLEEEKSNQKILFKKKLYDKPAVLINDLLLIKSTSIDLINGKHFEQLTKIERIYLMNRLLIATKNIKFAKHSLDRMFERNISERNVIKALKQGQIIDVRKGENLDLVVTIRGCIPTRKDKFIYAAFSIDKSLVITTYANEHFKALEKKKHLNRYNQNFKLDIPKNIELRLNFLYN